jgi:hypothetical protein
MLLTSDVFLQILMNQTQKPVKYCFSMHKCQRYILVLSLSIQHLQKGEEVYLTIFMGKTEITYTLFYNLFLNTCVYLSIKKP